MIGADGVVVVVDGVDDEDDKDEDSDDDVADDDDKRGTVGGMPGTGASEPELVESPRGDGPSMGAEVEEGEEEFGP